MNAARSLAVGAALAAAVTAGTAAFTAASFTLLLGVAPLYFAAGAIAASHPEVWRVEGSLWSGLFAGLNTWGVTMLMQGVGEEPRLDVVVLAFGLSVFALLCGAMIVLDEDRGVALRAPGTQRE